MTEISAGLILGWSSAKPEPAAAPVAVLYVAWGPGSFPVASSSLAGGSSFAGPAPFLELLSLSHVFAVPHRVTNFPTIEICPLFLLSSGCAESLHWPYAASHCTRAGSAVKAPMFIGCTSESSSALLPSLLLWQLLLHFFSV